MTSIETRNIDESAVQQRLDNFLIKTLKVPRALIYRIIRKGEVRVNQKRVDPTYRLQINDSVRIPPIRLEAKASNLITVLSKQKSAALEKTLIFENDLFIVINKPSGLSVHSGTNSNMGLIEQLRASRPEAKFLELVHRLDRGTSGCLLIAKKMSVLRELHTLLREHQVKKTYHALVFGRFPKNLNKIDFPIEQKPAQTTIQVLEKNNNTTLIAAHPLTGRKHQIRIHLAKAGFPIVGDDQHGDFEKNKALAKSQGLRRLCLHADALSFTLPMTGESFRFRAVYRDF